MWLICPVCNKANHFQQNQCWVCGYTLTADPHVLEQEIVTAEQVAPQPMGPRPIPSRNAGGAAATAISGALMGVIIALGSALAAVFLVLLAIVAFIGALLTACAEICRGVGGALLQFPF